MKFPQIRGPCKSSMSSMVDGKRGVVLNDNE